MDHAHTYADHRRDTARLQAVRGHEEQLPPGPSLGLARLGSTAPSQMPVPEGGVMPGGLTLPAVVTAIDCETETARVDDFRIAVTKVVRAAGWTPGTLLDVHVDPVARRVWLRAPHVPDVRECGCHDHDPDHDPRPAIPGVQAVLAAGATVQSRGRVKLPPNLLSLLGAATDSGRVTATTVADLDAVVLVDAGEYLRRLLPELAVPAADNVVPLRTGTPTTNNTATGDHHG